jgi:NADH oxidase (H2O2-forming)
MRTLVVGCGAAGATAAQFARKADRQAEVVVLTRESYGEYSKCGLPYALSGVVAGFENLIEYSPAWFRRFGIELRCDTEITEIDTVEHSITAIRLPDGGEERLGYDRLILATGARSKIPHTPGALREDGTLQDGIFTLRTMDDAMAIRERMTTASSGMIIGSGLIGMEMAEAMLDSGIETYVRLRTHVLTGMVDEDMARTIEEAAEAKGIRFIRRTTVSSVRTHEHLEVTLRDLDTGDESRHPVDMAIISAGADPETTLAIAAGCAIGEGGGIVVDPRGRTNVDGIYAAGDCTAYPDFVTGKMMPVGLGSIAVRQGRVAGTCAAGGDECLPEGLLNARTTCLFGLEIAAVGPTLAQLRQAGIESVVGKVTGSTRPDYFPGGTSITVKVLADPKNSRILGAQAIGAEGAHLRINTLAAAIVNHMTLGEFVQMETCYAPPLAPTLDCMTLAADSANIKVKRVSQREANRSD